MSDPREFQSAFPWEVRNEGGSTDIVYKGMSLRDYFAAKAMQGLVIDAADHGYESSNIAAASYLMADAMLKARAVTE